MAAKKGKILKKTETNYHLFAKEYVANFANGTQAYIKVYPQTKKDTAAVSASRLLKKVKVIELINAEYEKLFKEKDSQIEKSKTYKMIHAIGDSDISDVVDLENGTLQVKDISEIPVKARQAIQALKFHRRETKDGADETIEVKMHPKLQALELRAKLQGMLQEKVEMTGEIIVKPAVRPDKEEK